MYDLLHKKKPARGINDSKIRVSGTELRAALHHIECAQKAITDIYKEALGELEFADPTSDQGKSLESITLALSRMSNHISITATLYDCVGVMESFGTGAAPTQKTPPVQLHKLIYPKGKETLLCRSN